MKPPSGLPSARSVLFAMNDVTAAHALASILESRSHTARVACSALEALECEIDSVVVAEFGDVGLSESSIDGLELIADLRALGACPTVILIATRPSQEQYRRALRLGATDVLERPLVPEDLIRAVESSSWTAAERFGEPAPQALRAHLTARPGAAEAAARDLVGWCTRCEVTPPARARIGSAIAEVVQNSVDHGAHQVRLTASIDGRYLEVEVVDDGPGFDSVATLTDGVLDASTGLGRIYSLAEEVSIDSCSSGGTRVSLRFSVTTIDFDDDSRIDLSDLDYFVSATAKELLATLAEDPDAPIVLSPALAVVVGRLLVGPDPTRLLHEALRSEAR